MIELNPVNLHGNRRVVALADLIGLASSKPVTVWRVSEPGQADFLPQWVGSEAPSAAGRAIKITATRRCLQRDLDTGADGRTIDTFEIELWTGRLSDSAVVVIFLWRFRQSKQCEAG